MSAPNGKGISFLCQRNKEETREEQDNQGLHALCGPRRTQIKDVVDDSIAQAREQFPKQLPFLLQRAFCLIAGGGSYYAHGPFVSIHLMISSSSCCSAVMRRRN